MSRGCTGLRLTLMLLICLLTCPLLFSPIAAAATEQPLQKKVVLVLVNGLRLSDISEQGTPNLWQMAESGAIGVMNHHTAGAKNDLNSYLTLGAGAKAGVTPPVGTVDAYEALESAPGHGLHITGRQLYVRNMGVEPDGRIVLPQLPTVKKQDDSKRFSSRPGLLGDVVKKLGGETAVLGNADLGDSPHRPAVLIAMNSWGIVDRGDLQAGVKRDLTRPYGLSTDPKALYQRYEKVRDANLIVIETGDMTRWQHLYPLMELSQQIHAYQESLQAADQLVGMLLPEVNADTMLAVVSPTKHPAPDAPPLSPVLLTGGDLTAQGLLTSGTTKRTGLIANYDLAPTFVNFLGADPNRYPFLGQPVISQEEQTVADAGSSYGALTQIVDRMMVPSLSRTVLVRFWVDAWIGVAALIFLAHLLRTSWSCFLNPLTEIMLIFPLSWLFVPMLRPSSVAETVLVSLGVTGIVWLLLQGVRDRLTRLGSLAGATVLVLVTDVLLGAPLLKQSVLSYDPTVGARYYGIGNEYMGILLGAMLLWINMLTGSHRNWRGWERVLALLLFAFVTYLFAAPTLGTNAGGALAAAIGFAYAFLHLTGMMRLRMNWHTWLWLGGALAVVLTGMIVLNTLLPSSQQTHIGRAAGLLLSGQFGEVLDIALRKVQLNLHLLRVSAWGKLMLLSLAVLILWRNMQQPASVSRQDGEQVVPEAGRTYLLLQRNGRLLLVAAGAAFLFNDSGVVAAALILLYAIVPLTEQEEEERKIVRNTSPLLGILATETAPQE